MEVFILNYQDGFYFFSNLIIILSILIGLIIYLLKFRNNTTELLYQKTEINEKILEDCDILKKYSKIPIWGINGHIQTIYASQIRKGPTYPFKR